MPDDPPHEPPHLSPEQIREIAERRAEALKRVQAIHHKDHREADTARGGKPPKGPAPPKGRHFRHQGR